MTSLRVVSQLARLGAFAACLAATTTHGSGCGKPSDDENDAAAGATTAGTGNAGAAGLGSAGDGGNSGSGAGADGTAGASGAAADDADAGEAGRNCGPGGCGRFVTGHAGRVDLLFVVDSSGSMIEEQRSLAAEFPRMMQKLVTGDHDQDGTAEYAAVTDLHLGVVSPDLGVAWPGIDKCEQPGDSGRLLDTATVEGCAEGYPTFLEYKAGDDSAQVATDFACLAQVGTNGCGFEQPLEAALQALWPSSDPSIRFVAEAAEDSFGRGDRDNAGFLRNDPRSEPATLAIVVVSDEDDCSVFDTDLWTPDQWLPVDDPKRTQGLNVRCFFNPTSLWELERYYHGYRALHGYTGARVLFAAIVGVPVELVDQDALAQVDWNDDAQREAHYQKILDDPLMVETLEENSTPEHYDDNLAPSCMTEHGTAYPPRRIVSLARMFGPNSLVQSICGDNLGPPIEIIIRQVVVGPE